MFSCGVGRSRLTSFEKGTYTPMMNRDSDLYPPSTFTKENNEILPMSTTVTPPIATTTTPVLLGPKSSLTKCPLCNAGIKTTVKYKTTTRTHITALLCCTMCCCCLPYCLASARNTDHYCPNCSKYIGTYEK